MDEAEEVIVSESGTWTYYTYGRWMETEGSKWLWTHYNYVKTKEEAAKKAAEAKELFGVEYKVYKLQKTMAVTELSGD